MSKVLLIDDSITQLETLKLRFLKAGYDVAVAKDGYEGYQKVFEQAPDLILSDIIMPNLNGFQLCRLLKNSKDTQQIPIILLTVLDKKIDKFWANKSGANKFISKTAQFEEIQNSVELLLQENSINDEYKENLKKNTIDKISIQNQVNDIFDGLLMNSTFLSEFRNLNKFLSHEEVLIEKTFELLNSFVDYEVAGIFLNNPDIKEKKVLSFDCHKVPISSFVVEKIKRDFFSKVFDNMENFSLRDFNHEIVKECATQMQPILNIDKFSSVLILPLKDEDKVFGGICFYNQQETNYKDFKFYETMANELLLLLKMRYLYSESEHLSVTDGLTGLYNRRHFESNIEREFLRVKRYPADLSLAMIDIDFFKKINDTYGHQFGDYVLREISKLICASFRKTDMIYRYGGEEIVVILTQTSLENSFIPLERLREKVSQHVFSYNGKETNVTISIGISCDSKDLTSYQMLIERADEALYKAKQNGRNKVIKASYEQPNNVL